MRYVSIFSGVEAATLAWEPIGWEPVCFAEFDEFPSAVLAERYPEVPNVGDVTKMNWKKYRNRVDMVVGGSPCQSFSIAGKRRGLQGESGLMFEYIRAVREIRPRWFLWENVPGALSSENGEAFRQLKTDEEIAEARDGAHAKLREMGYEFVNTLFTDDWYSDEAMEERGVVQIPLCYLAKSLENMSLCHVVYFCKGWENARGCRIEHDAAVAYGLEVLYED